MPTENSLRPRFSPHPLGRVRFVQMQGFDPQRGSCIQALLGGCLLVALLVAMVMLGTYFYMKQHRTEVFSGYLTDFVERKLDESQLSEEESTAIKQEMSRLTEKYMAEEIGEADLLRFTDAFGEGEVFLAFALRKVERDWLPDSPLSREEKTKAAGLLRQTRRGLIDGHWDVEQVVFIEKAIPLEEDGWGGMQLVEAPSDQQIRSLVGDLEVMVEQAALPEGEGEPDYVAFTQRLVDRILANPISGKGIKDPEAPSTY